MALYADPRGGGLILDRRVCRERFKRALGLPDTVMGRRQAKQYDAMLDALVAQGQFETIEALRVGTLRFDQVWRLYQARELSSLHDPVTQQPLRECVESWVPVARKLNGQPVSEAHRRDLRHRLEMLLRLAPKAKLADVALVLREYRDECIRRDIGRSFNLTRAAVQSLVRELCGKRRSRLYGEVADVPILGVTPNGGRRLTVEEAVEVRNQLPPALSAVWWTGCTTGMRPSELWGRWEARSDGLMIHGTKTRAARRYVPLVAPAAVPLVSYWTYCHRLPDDVQPRTSRRFYAMLLERAGIPRTRRRMYLGHRAQDVSDLYETVDVRPYLAEDTAALLRALSPENPHERRDSKPA